MNRRLFLSSLAAAAGCLRGGTHVPIRPGKTTKLFQSPDGHPNCVEATPEGIWSGEQLTGAAYLLDWKTGKVLKKVPTESHNTNGIAFGDGYLWIAASGAPSGPTRILKIDPDDGRTLGVFANPEGGGVHEMSWGEDSLWFISPKANTIVRVNPATFEVQHKVVLQLPGAHGMALDLPSSVWVLYQDAHLIMKQSIHDSYVIDIVSLKKDVDPVPHGMDMYQGKLYSCDAGLRSSPTGPAPDNSPTSGFIFRIDI